MDQPSAPGVLTGTRPGAPVTVREARPPSEKGLSIMENLGSREFPERIADFHPTAAAVVAHNVFERRRGK